MVGSDWMERLEKWLKIHRRAKDPGLKIKGISM
jgi:hypothetical protein